MKTAIADLHCHPTLRLFGGDKNIWYSDKIDDKTRDNKAPSFSEAEFSALAKSRVRLVFVALYPIEQGFITNLGKEVDLITDKPNENELLNLTIGKIISKYSKNGTLIDLIEKVLARYISGMKFKKFKQIRSSNHEYFDDLLNEYQYLIDGIKSNSPIINGKIFNLKIAENYTDLTNILKIDSEYNYLSEQDNNIAIVITVEGGHSLGIGQINTNHISIQMLNNIDGNGNFINTEVTELFNKVNNNIVKLKSLNNGTHSPFFITFAHHFWNQLCGHNMSFAATAHKIFDQRNGINESITEFGKKVICELLSDKNGRRILIDTKHMSVKTKLWYYNFIKDFNQKNGVKIPIISSHSAVSGNKILSTQNATDENYMDEQYTNSQSVYNMWDINLSDEEIVLICESEGLIGLNFDERILSGKKMLDFIKQQPFDVTQILNYRSRWAEPLLQNILHIIDTIYSSNIINKEYVWNLITLGTDYDGIINPIDAYCYAEDLETLRNILILKLENIKNSKTFLINRNSTEIVDNIMFKNSLIFLSKHFEYNSKNNNIA